MNLSAQMPYLPGNATQTKERNNGKMKFKKVIGLLTLSALIVTASPVPGKTYIQNYFPKDTDSHWAEESITELMNMDILKGADGNAYPDRTITRGEFAALTARTLDLEPSYKDTFGDIGKEHMFYGEINALSEKGIVMGVGDGTFQSNRTVTREEIMLMLSRVLPENVKKQVNFKDISKGYTHLESLKKAIGSGIISGFDDNTFRPKANASRAECASMLVRLLKTLEEPSEVKVRELAENYINNDMANRSNRDISTGRALSELKLKDRARELISSNGATIEKLVSDGKISDVKIEGAIAKVTYTADTDYVMTTKDTSRNAGYKATYKIGIINRNDGIYVYDASLNLSKNERLNLTWEVYSSPPDYAPAGVNAVSPSSFQISAENLGVEKLPLFGNVNFYNSLTRNYMNYARQNGYEVWPIYKTDFSLKTSDSFLNNADARMKSIEYIIKYATKYGIDGLNIDFENVYKKNRHLLSQHARELSVMLHELGLIVSADVTRIEPTSANWSMCYDRNVLSESCDYIMLMAYDEYYASSTSAGPVASLDWVEDSVKKTLKEVPAEKLVLGIPFYMRYFEVTGNKVTSTKAISMQTAYELIQKNNPTYTYMESDGQYKISWKSGNKTCIFWLENTDTVLKRVNLANKYSLAGVASWRRGLEINKVWEVIENNL